MPKLSVTRTYADNQSPVQSDFDAIIDDIEILVNTILLDDDNFQTGGIDAETKLIDGTIQANQIRNNNVTSEKIADGTVANSNFADEAVTTAKIAAATISETQTSILAGYLPPGAVQMFHSFDSTVSYPRGWMLLDGSVVNETNYDVIHGSGAYVADSVASSALLDKTLPDMTDKYAIGVLDTTKDGSGAVDSVGNTGSTVDLTHTHETSHKHSLLTSTRQNAVSATQVIAAVTTDGLGDEVKSGNRDITSSSTLSATQSIRPESIEVLYIIKVV